MDKEKAPDTEAQIYVFLKPPYVVEPDLPFVPGPEPQHKLTPKEFDQGMFQLAKKGIQAPVKPTRYKAMVTMRQIVGLIEAREQTFVQEYIEGQLIDYCFREIKKNRSQILRYEALLILDNIVDDSRLCWHLMAQKNCIQVLFDFLGYEDHTLLRNKAKNILRDIIFQNILTMDPKDNPVVADVIKKLQAVKKRIQAREIVWIIQKIYNNDVGSKQPEIVDQACSVFCEAIKSSLYELDESQGSDLSCVLQGLAILSDQHQEVISRYEILGLLMNYARLGENLSLPAMIILEGLAEKLLQNNDFFNLAQFHLAEKQEKTWSTLTVLFRILQQMAYKIQFLDILLQRPQLLKSLTSLLWQNKDPQKNKVAEEKKQQAIPQIASSICNLYLSMISTTKKHNQNENKTILDFIFNQNILAVAFILLSAQRSSHKHWQLGLETIERIATFVEGLNIEKVNISEHLNGLKILPFLQDFQKSADTKLSEPAQRIHDTYFPKLSKQIKQGTQGKQGKDDKQDKEDKEAGRGEDE